MIPAREIKKSICKQIYEKTNLKVYTENIKKVDFPYCQLFLLPLKSQKWNQGKFIDREFSVKVFYSADTNTSREQIAEVLSQLESALSPIVSFADRHITIYEEDSEVTEDNQGYFAFKMKFTDINDFEIDTSCSTDYMQELDIF